MDNFNKVYYDLILESNDMISEGKFLNNVLAGIGGLAITGGSVLGLNELSKQNTPQKPETQQTQQVMQAEPQDVKPVTEPKVTPRKLPSQKIVLNAEEYFIARVLYSETSTLATKQEIMMVCQIIVNRIGHRDFGKCSNAYEVVRHKNAFSCIGDKNNSNCNEFKPELNERTKLCSKLAKFLMRSDAKQITFFNDKSIVYYHDDSISTPKKWTNKYWKPILKYTTKNFKFYSITSNVKRTK